MSNQKISSDTLLKNESPIDIWDLGVHPEYSIMTKREKLEDEEREENFNLLTLV